MPSDSQAIAGFVPVRSRDAPNLLELSNDERCRKAAFDWLRSPRERAAGTVTFRDRRNSSQLSEPESVKTVKMFLRFLNGRIFGNAVDRGARLPCIVIREGWTRDYGKRLHYHLQIEPPDDMTAGELADLCVFVWRGMKLSGREFCFEPARDDAWLNYILKPRDKPGVYQDSFVLELWERPSA